jgi:hypothetical protein
MFFKKKPKKTLDPPKSTEPASMPDNPDNEIITSASHIFDIDNNWIGYEYEVFVSENHVRISRYDNSGNIVGTKHKFVGTPNSQSVDDFIAYMDKAKSIASNNNSAYLQEMGSKPIDTKSSIREAKSFAFKK